MLTDGPFLGYRPNMILAAYLQQHKISMADFAIRSGIRSRQLVHKYVHGKLFPGPANLRAIREATEGSVTAEDFVDQHLKIEPQPAEAAQ